MKLIKIGIATVTELSAATYRKMIQNLWWAAGYNIVAIPLAYVSMLVWTMSLQLRVAYYCIKASLAREHPPPAVLSKETDESRA